MSNIKLKTFYDPSTYTLTYLIYDEKSSNAVIIDPVLNYDAASSTTSKESIEELNNFIHENKLSPGLILETHAHADHITGAYELKRIYSNIKIGVGEGITKVQKVFKKAFNLTELNDEDSV